MCSLEQLKLKKDDNPNVGKDREQPELVFFASRSAH